MNNKHTRHINKNAQICPNWWNVHILFYEQAVYESRVQKWQNNYMVKPCWIYYIITRQEICLCSMNALFAQGTRTKEHNLDCEIDTDWGTQSRALCQSWMYLVTQPTLRTGDAMSLECKFTVFKQVTRIQIQTTWSKNDCTHMTL